MDGGFWMVAALVLAYPQNHIIQLGSSDAWCAFLMIWAGIEFQHVAGMVLVIFSLFYLLPPFVR
jgi:hypothetical protein